jgi:nickel/cobalt transporter (NicO) family protein
VRIVWDFMTSYRTRRRVGIVLAALLMGLTLQQAFAHPLGNFSINYYSRLEVAPTRIDIFQVVDLAEVPTFQLKQVLDANGNNQMDAAEWDAYVAEKTIEVRDAMKLTVNGVVINLSQPRDSAIEVLPGQGGLDTFRLSFWVDVPLSGLGETPFVIDFRDANDSDRIGWREIVLRARAGVSISEADASDKDVSNELREYPADLLNNPMKKSSATFKVAAVAGAGAVSGTATQTTAAATDGGVLSTNQLAGLINYGELTPQVVFFSLAAALGLGAFHALEPGHGKSLAGAYLVGSRATPYHAVLLGGTVTVTHTASVFLMGLVTLFLSRWIVPEQLFPYLGLGSAGIVIAMGIGMIVNALRERAAAAQAGHDHTLDPNAGPLTHSHGGKAHTHVPKLNSGGKVSVRNVLAVGISGGLIPCPAALIVMLSAIALGRIGFGMLLIVAFSVGLAAVLTLVSLGVVYGKRMIGKVPLFARMVNRVSGSGRFVQALPVLSGVLVLAAGGLLLYYSVPYLRLIY